jgi:hypothetical protein
MTRDIIIIGTGAYFMNLVQPGIPLLQHDGIVRALITVDTAPRDEDKVMPALRSSRHIVRGNRPLSAVVDGIDVPEPFVILGHSNELHTPEAAELLDNARCSPRVLIEKPYAITFSQKEALQATLQQHEGRVGLLEYYLNMKAVPLLWFGGVVAKDSFYAKALKQRSDTTLDALAGRMEEYIGTPLHVISDCLEGEGGYGTVRGRNSSLVDRDKGGGMIQDLGHHALSPLIALEGYLGKLKLQDLRFAHCSEYVRESQDEFHLPTSRIGESYAEMDYATDKGVSVKVALGKYVENGTNQRRITIVGTRGVVLYDMTKNILAYQRGDATEKTGPMIESDKVTLPKYLPTIQGALETMEGRNPFAFNPFNVAMRAQEHVLNLVAAKELYQERTVHYRAGAMHDTIFR